MQCEKPVWITKNLDKRKFPDGLMVCCGKCFACRRQRAREWALRLEHERPYANYGIFTTLTYDNEHIPKNYSLKKSDLQNYFKRLRKYGIKLKYYASGEYGGRFSRPHYHAVIFVYDTKYKYEDFITIYDINGRVIQNGILADIWKNGNVQSSRVTTGRILYCVSYVDKKIMDIKKIDIGKRYPPFRLTSNGFGRSYVNDNKAELLEAKAIRDRGHDIGLPRYYKKMLGIPPEEIHQKARSNEFIKFKKYMELIGEKKMDQRKWELIYAQMGVQKALNEYAKNCRDGPERNF